MLPFAVRTGLESATPGVTGRYSNQLNYHHHVVESRGIEPRSQDFQSCAYTWSAKTPFVFL